MRISLRLLLATISITTIILISFAGLSQASCSSSALKPIKSHGDAKFVVRSSFPFELIAIGQ